MMTDEKTNRSEAGEESTKPLADLESNTDEQTSHAAGLNGDKQAPCLEFENESGAMT